MRTLPAACCLLIAALALDACPARAQFRLSLPSDDRPVRFRLRRQEAPPPSVSEMLLNEMLQWELKLTDEQIDKLEDTETTVKQRHQEEADRLARVRREAVDASLSLRRKIAREQREVMQNILTPVQRDRVRQVEIQLAGPAAFFDPDVQRALQLTDEQTEAMQKALSELSRNYTEESRRARRAAAPAGPFPAGGGAAALEKRAAELSKRALRALEGRLTPEQKKQWAKLVGEPCAAVEKWNAGPFGRRVFLVSPFRRGQQPIDTLGPDEVAEKLRDELKLSEEQATRIGNLPEVIAGGHKDERKQIEKQEEEQGKAQAALEARQAGAMAKAMTAVLKPEQRRRLEQVRLQLLGLAAWDDPAARKALRLTADQQAAIKKARDEAKATASDAMMQAMREARRQADGDYRRAQRLQDRKAAAAYRAVMDRIVAQLAPEQQKQWRELTGLPVRLRVNFSLRDR